MSEYDIRILKAGHVQTLLTGREHEIIQTVRLAYETHAKGASSLPHSTFLLFPEQPQNRIIALPAYLGDGMRVAGVKWIASFPDNHARGLDRASAVVIVNSVQTGRPEAILEGSIISAKRTAASAALAAQYLHCDGDATQAGLIGCGVINLEIARFLLAVFPKLDQFVLFDKDPARAEQFAAKCERLREGCKAQVAPDIHTVLKSASLISFATTAAEPHVHDLEGLAPGSTILHISLRDLAPEVILACDNLVDDLDHVMRARTSLHLTEQRVGHRQFVRCTLADVTRGQAAARKTPDGITVFSPFGLGVLDLAISQLALELAQSQNQGSVIDSFLPETTN